jgi:hypothetical protein
MREVRNVWRTHRTSRCKGNKDVMVQTSLCPDAIMPRGALPTLATVPCGS